MSDGEASEMRRLRIVRALAGLVVIGIGLACRSEWLGLPQILAKYAGDALWASLVYFAFGILWPALAIRCLVGWAFAFSCAVEFSQLYHAPWIDSLRATRLGALTLGSVFSWPDLGAYALGIALGGVSEWAGRWRDPTGRT